MDRLKAAEVFIDVVNSGSFSASAERLDMSRPMVTRYVESLEGWLQVRLLHRTTRSLSLTSEGEGVIEEIESWITQADKVTSLALNKNRLSGNLRIATSMSFGFSQLVGAVQEFMQLHPDINIDIDLSDNVTDLIKSRIDLAIRIAADPDPSLIGKPIALCDSLLVASPSYLSSKEEINDPQDLFKHECLGYKNFERHIWHLSKGDQYASVSTQCKLTANEATLLLHAALNGMGISLQPKYLVTEYLESGELIHVLPDWKPNDLSIYVLYSSRKYLSANIRALIDYLSQYFSEHRW